MEKICKVLSESPSSYYYWRKNPESKRDVQQKELSVYIQQVYEESKGMYGSPRIAAELAEKGIHASRPRVARAMKKMGLKSIVRKKYRIQTTDSKHIYQVSENKLNRNFSAERVAQKWVSDLTAAAAAYIKTNEGWIYLTMIMDLADRKVVGWALSATMKAEDTSVAAWRMALKRRPIEKPLLFHRSGDPV